MMGNSDIVGSVDGVGLDQVDGWAYREGVPAEHLSVSVQLDGVTIGTAVADAYRVDLQEGGIGDGDHAYSIKLDRELSDEERGHVVVLASSSHGDGFEIPLPAANQEGVEEEAAEEEGAPAVAPGQGTLYAESAPLLAPVGYPADFIDDEALANARSWVDVDLEVLKEAIRRDVFAIPHSFNREGYADGFDLTFWLSGYVDYLSLQSIAAEYGVKGSFEAVPYTAARWLKGEVTQLREFADKNKYNTAEDASGALAYLAPNDWHLQRIAQDWPGIIFAKTRELG